MINQMVSYDQQQRTAPQIILSFQDGRQVSYETHVISEIAPTFFCSHALDSKIQMPSWISVEDLSTYIMIFQNGNDYISEYTDITKLLRTSEFFENESFSYSLLNEIIIPRLSIENSLNFLMVGYEKLSEASKNNNDVDNIWFDFFIKCLDIVGKNLNYYLKKGKFEEIRKFDSKILDELYEKFSCHLICGNFYFTDDPSLDTLRGNAILVNNMKEMINFLMKYRAQKNFYDLLTNEYMKICSEDNINELNALPNPTFLLKLNINEIDSYYEEYKIDVSMGAKEIVIVVFYRKSDDSFNVSFKLVEKPQQVNKVPSSFKIVTFISSVLIEEISNRQINVKSITNNKSMHAIYKVNNMKSVMNSPVKEYGYITLKIYLKPCFIHSMLTSYLLYNFNELYNEKSISKVSKQLLVLILKNKNINLANEDRIAIALLNWLDDEINIKGDITEIVEYIKWENVSLDLLFEFIIKYGKNISNEDIEHIFIKAFESKCTTDSNEFKVFNRNVIENLIKTAKKINFADIYAENKKLSKINSFNTSTQFKDYSTSQFISNYHSNSIGTRDKLKTSGNHNKSISLVLDKSISSENKKSTKGVVESLSTSKQNESISSSNYIRRAIPQSSKTITTKKKTNNIRNIGLNRNCLNRNTSTTFAAKRQKTKSFDKKINKSFVGININTKLTISNNFSVINTGMGNSKSPKYTVNNVHYKPKQMSLLGQMDMLKMKAKRTGQKFN